VIKLGKIRMIGIIGLLLTIAWLGIFNANRIINTIFHLTYGWEYNPDGKLASMVNSVIGIPYHQKPSYINDSSDIKRLTQEEWFTLPYFHKAVEIDIIEDPLHLVPNMPTVSEAEHAASLTTSYPMWLLGARKAIYDKLCGNLLFCDAITLTVQQDYVFKKPEILGNMIKIAKRPCDYIKASNEIKPGEEIVFSHDFGFRGHKFKADKYKLADVQEAINAANANFSCDKRGFWNGGGVKSLPIFRKKFVLIMINEKGLVSSDDDKTLDIIVTREDI
jgi:hypothetical protein